VVRLRQLPKVDADAVLHSLPVVALTSSREERDMVESYQLGENSSIVKPIEFDRFLETVQALEFYWGLLDEPPVAAVPDAG
jgi:DNA-binding response OmpR family regulator